TGHPRRASSPPTETFGECRAQRAPRECRARATEGTGGRSRLSVSPAARRLAMEVGLDEFDGIDEAPVARCRRVDLDTGPCHPRGAPPAYPTGDAPRPPGPGHETETELGQQKRRVATGDDPAGEGRDLDARADARAVDDRGHPVPHSVDHP